MVASDYLKASKDLIDSLPYIDKELNQPDINEEVNRLVEEEMKTFSPSTIFDRTPEQLFGNHDMLKNEMKRVSKKRPLVALDTSRYRIDPPENNTQLEAWENATKNSAAQAEHMNLRLVNLELLKKFGGNAWKMHNYELEYMGEVIEKELEAVTNEVTILNKQRKVEQLNAVEKLSTLKLKLNEVLERNSDLVEACSQLEREVEQLRKESSK